MTIQRSETLPVRTRTKAGLTVHFIGHGYEHLTMQECETVLTPEQKEFIATRKWSEANKLARAQEFVDENLNAVTYCEECGDEVKVADTYKQTCSSCVHRLASEVG